MNTPATCNVFAFVFELTAAWFIATAASVSKSSFPREKINKILASLKGKQQQARKIFYYSLQRLVFWLNQLRAELGAWFIAWREKLSVQLSKTKHVFKQYLQTETNPSANQELMQQLRLIWTP